MVIVCADKSIEGYRGRSLEAWLRECHSRGMGIGALGSGAYVLAKAGLLENKLCAIHWEELPDFSERYSSSQTCPGIFEFVGQIWTCAGGAASFHVMLHLIAREFGEHVVASVCEKALVERARSADERQRIPFTGGRTISNSMVLKLVRQMEQNLVEPLSLARLASHARLSRRQIERIFQRELNFTPMNYYKELRLEHAKLLLGRPFMSIIDIALSCGFRSASHFSKCFRDSNGVSPQEFRKAKMYGKERARHPAVL